MEKREGVPAAVRVFEINKPQVLIVPREGSRTSESIRLALPEGLELTGSILIGRPGGFQRGRVYDPYNPEVSVNYNEAQLGRKNGRLSYDELFLAHLKNPTYYNNIAADKDLDHPDARVSLSIRMQNPAIRELIKEVENQVLANGLSSEQAEEEFHRLLTGNTADVWAQQQELYRHLGVNLTLPPYGLLKEPLDIGAISDTDPVTGNIFFINFYPLQEGPLPTFDVEPKGDRLKKAEGSARYAEEALACSGFPLRLPEEVLANIKISFSLGKTPRASKSRIIPLM